MPFTSFVRKLLLRPVVAPARLTIPVATVLLAASFGIRADEPVAVTPDELVSLVRASDPRMAALDARAAAAKADPRAARIWANPTLSWRREEVSASGETAADSYLELSLPLDVSGRRGHRAAALDAAADAVSGEVGARRLDLVLDALAAWGDAARATERVAILKAGRDALAAVAASLRARYGEGDVSGYDLGRIEVELATVEDLLAEAETEETISERALARAAGRPDARFRAAGPLEAPTGPGPLAELLEKALANRGDRRAAASRARQEEELGIVAGRGWIPGFELGGGGKSVTAAGSTASGYVAAIGLTLPLFDRGQADRERARARIAEARNELSALDRAIRGEVEDAAARLGGLLARLRRLADLNSHRAEQLTERAEAAFREGEIGAFELVDAHRTAREARLRALEVRWQASRAELELRRATGNEP